MKEITNELKEKIHSLAVEFFSTKKEVNITKFNLEVLKENDIDYKEYVSGSKGLLKKFLELFPEIFSLEEKTINDGKQVYCSLTGNTANMENVIDISQSAQSSPVLSKAELNEKFAKIVEDFFLDKDEVNISVFNRFGLIPNNINYSQYVAKKEGLKGFLITFSDLLDVFPKEINGGKHYFCRKKDDESYDDFSDYIPANTDDEDLEEQTASSKYAGNLLITNIKITKIEKETSLRANAEITLGSLLVVRNIKILEKHDQLILGMPSVKGHNEQYKDVVFPINANVRAAIERLLFNAYTLLADSEENSIYLLLKDASNVEFEEIDINSYDITYGMVDYSALPTYPEFKRLCISAIKIKRIQHATLKAVVDITLENRIVIKNIKVICKASPFIAMPSVHEHDIAFPINQESRDSLVALILGLYEEMDELNASSAIWNIKDDTDNTNILVATSKNYCIISQVAIKESVIKQKSSKTPKASITPQNIDSHIEKGMLEAYENFDYRGVLEIIKNNHLTPNLLSRKMFNIAVNAVHFLIDDSIEELELSEFHYKVYSEPTSFSFVSYKRDKGFKELMRLGIESRLEKIGEGTFENDFSDIANYYNIKDGKRKKANTHNNTYAEVIRRFSCCNNIVVPYLYYLWLYTCESLSKYQDILNNYIEYCTKLKSIRGLIGIIDEANIIGFNLPEQAWKSILVKALGRCIDFDCMDDFEELISKINSPVCEHFNQIVKSLNEIDYSNEEDICHIFNNIGSTLLAEKIMYCYWYTQNKNNDYLDSSVINMLSNILVLYGEVYLDEIIHMDIRKEFNRTQKRNILIQNFSAIVQNIEYNPYSFALAEYILNTFDPNRLEACILEWIEQRKDYVTLLKGKYSIENSIDNLPILLRIFIVSQEELNDIYASAGAFALNEAISMGDSIEYIESLISANKKTILNASIPTLIKNVDFEKLCERLGKNKTLKLIIDAYIEQSLFKEAIDVVSNGAFDVLTRENYIVDITSLNFGKYGISAKAYEMFDSSFSIDDAERFLTKRIANKVDVKKCIVSLIGILAYKNKTLHILYLLRYYKNATLFNNRKVYNNLNFMFKQTLTATKENPIILAVQNLSPSEFIKYLEWCKQIPISDFQSSDNVTPIPFSLYEDETLALIESSHSIDTWIKLINKARTRNRSLYYALVCVCLVKVPKVISDIYGETRACTAVLREVELDDLPYNIFALNNELINAKNSFESGYWETFTNNYISKITKSNIKDRCFFSIHEGDSNNNQYEQLKEFTESCLARYKKTNNATFLNMLDGCYKLIDELSTEHIEMLKLIYSKYKSKEGLVSLLISLVNERNIDLLRHMLDNSWGNIEGIAAIIYNMINECMKKDTLVIDDKYNSYIYNAFEFCCDCCYILSDYPKGINVENWKVVASRKDLSRDYLINLAKFIQDISYSDIVYDTIVKNTSAFPTSKLEQSALAEFICKSLTIQAYSKEAFGYQYTYRRYLKYVLSALLTEPEWDEEVIADTIEIAQKIIQDTMHKNGHFEMMYEDFENFANAVKSFANNANVDSDVKRNIFYCMISDQWYEFITHSLDTNICDIDISNLLLHLDYKSFVKTILQIDKTSNVESVLKMLCMISHDVYDILIHAYQTLNDANINKIERGFSGGMKYAAAQILKWNEHSGVQKIEKGVSFFLFVFTNYPFAIIKEYANMIRQDRDNMDLIYGDEYLYQLIDRYTNKNKNICATECYNYICALKYAKNQNKQLCNEYLLKLSDIPKIYPEWNEEYEIIKEYSINDETDALSLPEVVGLLDNKDEEKPITYATFLNRNTSVQKDFDLNQSINVILNEYLSIDERIESAEKYFASVLSGHEINDTQYSHNRIVFEYGLLLCDKNNTKADSGRKANILKELCNYWDFLNHSNKDALLNKMYQAFENVLEDLNFNQWVTLLTPIITFFNQNINSIYEENDYSSLFALIETVAAAYLNRDFSKMKKLEVYEHTNVGESNSYAKELFAKALKREVSGIKNQYVLSAEIQNNAITRQDTRIYFVVYNIGDVSLKLPSLNIELTCIDENNKNIPYFSESEVMPQKLRPDELYASYYHLKADTLETGTKITCTLKVYDELDELIVDTTTQLDIIDSKVTSTSDSFGYYSQYSNSSPAWSDGKEGIGRKKEIRNIKEKFRSDRRFMLLGASRSGKSSLLRYVENVLAKDTEYLTVLNEINPVKNVCTILISNYAPGNSLTQTLIAEPIALAAQGGGKGYYNDELSSTITAAYDEFNNSTLSEDSRTRTFLNKVSRALEVHDAEIWILYDEFQNALKNYTDPATIASLKSYFDGNVYNMSRIRFAICGADKMVTTVECELGGEWNETLKTIRRNLAIEVGNFTEEDRNDFDALYKNKKYLGEQTIFTPKALDYLWDITSGNISMSNNLVYQLLESRRDNIEYTYYPSHLYPNVFALIDSTGFENDYCRDLSELERKIAIVIAGITENDERAYRSRIEEYLNASIDEIANALTVLRVRSIIHSFGNAENEEYKFTNMIYLSYFSNKKNTEEFMQIEALRKKQSFDEEENFNESDISYETFIDFSGGKWYDFFNQFDDRILNKIMKKPIEAIYEERGLSIGGKVVNNTSETYGPGSSKTGPVTNNVVKIDSIKIDQIANSVIGLTDMISGGIKNFDVTKAEEQLAAIPRLELLPAGTVADVEDDELAVFDTDTYVENIQKGIKSGFEKTDFKDLYSWATVEVSKVGNDNKFSKMGIDNIEFLTVLSDEDRDCILLALYLKCLFDDVFVMAGKSNSTMVIDHAPITVMLGKALERLLQKYHLPIYQDDSIWINNVKPYSPNKDNDGVSAISFERATIGTFTTALAAMFAINDSDPEKFEKEENKENFIQYASMKDEKNWKEYKDLLFKAKGIRNDTAHVKAIAADACNKFIRMFFKHNLLKNTIEYVVHNEE